MKDMNKSDAIKRLDAIEREATELRKIIEKPDEVKFDAGKMYAGLYRPFGERIIPYLMTGDTADGYMFQCFNRGTYASSSYSDRIRDGQECLDYHMSKGFTIHAFDSTREAFEFFLSMLP